MLIMGFARLTTGEAAVYSKILRYLLFEASPSFIRHLKANNIDCDIAFLPDTKYLKAASNFLIDLFRYRVQLSPEQFSETGYAERKMLLVLDVYDIIKSVKSQSKIHEKLNSRDSQFQRGEEMSLR